jgi:hypothetical protein
MPMMSTIVATKHQNAPKRKKSSSRTEDQFGMRTIVRSRRSLPG